MDEESTESTDEERIDSGDEEDGGSRDWRNFTIIGLVVVVVALAGLIVGYVVTNDSSAAEAAGDSTTFPTVTTTFPSQTQPSDGGSAPATVAPGPLGPILDVPGQVTVFAVADTQIDSSAPEEILGFEDSLEVIDDSTVSRRALVRFEVSDVPDGQTVLQATLKLSAYMASTSSVTVDTVTGDWSEPDTTFLNAPGLGEPVSVQSAGPLEGVLELDVTRAVEGNGPVDFYISSTGDEPLYFSSKEAGATGPMLTVIWEQ